MFIDIFFQNVENGKEAETSYSLVKFSLLIKISHPARSVQMLRDIYYTNNVDIEIKSQAIILLGQKFHNDILLASVKNSDYDDAVKQ